MKYLETRPARRFSGPAALIALGIALASCGIARAPISDPPKTVATPLTGELIVVAQKSETVGDVMPVHLSVANGTDVPRMIVPSQVFALSDSGTRIAPIAPREAARRAGGSTALGSVLSGAAVGAGVAGAIGAGLGAAAGSALGAPGTGAIVGTAIGASEGILRSAERSQTKADRAADAQLEALALAPEPVRRNFTVSGYVFFPAGDYRELEIILIDGETGDTESHRAPIR